MINVGAPSLSGLGSEIFKIFAMLLLIPGICVPADSSVISNIEWINGRALAWDTLGTVPLDLTHSYTAEHLSAFSEMRKGEYGWAYSRMLKAFRKQPEDICGWILIECAKKQKNPKKLLSDLDTLIVGKTTSATRLLRFRAYHLALVIEQNKSDNNETLQKEFERKVDELREELLKQQSTHLPTVVALVNSQRTPVLIARQLSAKLALTTTHLEASILNVRSLIRGRFGYVTYQTNDPRSKRPKIAHADPVEGPRFEETLELLSHLDKKYPKNPLILYYYTMCYSFKNAFVQKTSPEYRQNKDKSMAWASKFPAGSQTYPRLSIIVEAFKKSGSYGVFHTMQDE